MVDGNFIDEHRRHILETLNILCSINLNSDLNKHEQAGTATFIMNIYSGIENILRHVLEEVKMTKLPRTSTWHKDILNQSVEKGMISGDLKENLSAYMRFRHRHVHGYGYMDDWRLVKPLALNAASTVDKFFFELKNTGVM